MATIHKKRSLIHKRQAEWSPKIKKAPESKTVSAARGFLATAWSGAKIIGAKMADPKFQQRLGDFARNAGEVSRAGFGVTPQKKKKKRR